MRLIKLLSIILLFSIIAIPASALPGLQLLQEEEATRKEKSASKLFVKSIDLDIGVFSIINADKAGGPSPVMPTLGGEICLVPFYTGLIDFYIQPGLQLFGFDLNLDYGWTESKALPVEIEAADAFHVIGTMFYADTGVLWKFHPRFELAAGGGLNFLLRIPTKAFGNIEQNRRETWAYFYGKGRFFYPSARIAFGTQLTDSVKAMIKGRYCFPLFRIWDQDNAHFLDQSLYSIIFSICFQL